MHTVQGSARDVSILYSAGNLLVNTREQFFCKERGEGGVDVFYYLEDCCYLFIYKELKYFTVNKPTCSH